MDKNTHAYYYTIQDRSNERLNEYMNGSVTLDVWPGEGCQSYVLRKLEEQLAGSRKGL